jgi:hypothetical protein
MLASVVNKMEEARLSMMNHTQQVDTAKEQHMINGLVGIKWNEQYINGRDEQNTSEF